MKSPEATRRVDSAPDRSTAHGMAPLPVGGRHNCAVNLGWGRVIFAHTYESNEKIAEALCEERRDERDIALYLRDPHVVLALAPQELFLDPSHTYRLWKRDYRQGDRVSPVNVRRVRQVHDAEEVLRIYGQRGMVTCSADKFLDQPDDSLRILLVAEDAEGKIVGTVTGIDHVIAFGDPENGSSLWCLAVDPQARIPGVGEILVRELVERCFARGRDFVDLSVMHDNRQAIRLYEKLGFQRVPVFCVKRKNPINEPLFIGPGPQAELNPYAQLIVDHARRRGIRVDVVDPEAGFFTLSLGGREIVCRESLTELTSAVAFCRCDDKRITHRVLASAGLRVPDQRRAGDESADLAFLRRHERVVVKPARGEQGSGVSVDVRTEPGLLRAIERAGHVDDDVVLEEFVEGEDLRIIVIDYKTVAAAVRRPPMVTGTGKHTVRQLIEKASRRREAATGGESHIPIDDETERCLRAEGHALDEVLPIGENLRVRKTANLHTGGTIHDVTPELHPELAETANKAARALKIPVVGLDLMVPSPSGPEHVFIEANERPGLANHEPQPTAERFIDLLFPETARETEA